MAYVARQHLHHDQFGYLVFEEATGRCLGGFGANYYRAWVYPLCTPRGLTVIQEFPFDHPFHNGLWVAQGRYAWAIARRISGRHRRNAGQGRASLPIWGAWNAPAHLR